MDRHSITGAGLSATIKAEGAELCSLRTAAGPELLWQAGPAWPRHAPNLFPIVGTLKGNRLVHRGVSYPMGRHGFARDHRFAWLERTPQSCRLMLHDNEQTRAVYPFAFTFEIAYAIAGNTLSITFTVTNAGNEILPASMGAHPAFAWPLREGVPKTAHRLEFAADEPAPIRRVNKAGLLLDTAFPTPIEHRMLALDEDVFAADAVILDQPASRSLRYSAPGTPVISFAWDAGFPHFGIWSPPGVELLCLEPWHGMSSPEEFDGEFVGKPGLMLIPPGGQRNATHRITVA
jgi:galactose mutarotase-like enzyme